VSRSKAKKAGARAARRARPAARFRFRLGDPPALWLGVGAGLTLLFVGLGFFEGSLWLGALSREVSPLWLALTLLFGCAALALRHFILGAILALAFVATLSQQVPLLRPAKLTPEKGVLFRVGEATLAGSHVEAQALSALLRESRLDLFAAVGVTQAARATIDAALSTWPQAARGLGPERDLAVWSRLPLRGVSNEPVLRVRVGQCDVQIAIASIPSLTRLSVRKARKERIAALEALHDSARAVWLGSLGSRPQAADLSTLMRKQRLRDTRVGHGLLATEPAWLGPMGFATDHILVRGWLSVRARSLSAPLGPLAHRTLLTTLELTEPRCQN